MWTWTCPATMLQFQTKMLQLGFEGSRPASSANKKVCSSEHGSFTLQVVQTYCKPLGASAEGPHSNLNGQIQLWQGHLRPLLGWTPNLHKVLHLADHDWRPSSNPAKPIRVSVLGTSCVDLCAGKLPACKTSKRVMKGAAVAPQDSTSSLECHPSQANLLC